MKCERKTEVYSRIVGYFRPIQNWNIGKQQEFKDRQEYSGKMEGAITVPCTPKQK